MRETGKISFIRILRVLCKKCDKTHAVLPDFLRPKSRYSQQVREKAIVGCVFKGATAEASTLDGQAVETSRRWVRQFKALAGEATATLTSLLAQWGDYDPPVAGRAFEGLRERLKRIVAHLGWWPAHSCRLGLINLLMNLGPPPRAYL